MFGKTLDSLKELDKPIRKRIFDKVNDYVSQDPTNLGKPLKDKFSGFWRYRFGDYQVTRTAKSAAPFVALLFAASDAWR
jgi:mRNA-degrading endonuclease RelE of RelBE toxin-antitoxin system